MRVMGEGSMVKYRENGTESLHLYELRLCICISVSVPLIERGKVCGL